MNEWFVLVLLLAVPSQALFFLWLFGLSLPRTYRAGRRVLLDAPPADVFRLLDTPEGVLRWRTDLRAVEPLPAVDGLPARREVPRRGRSRVVLVVARQPERRLDLDAAGQEHAPLGWQWRLEAHPRGTLLTLVEQGSHPFPLARTWARLGSTYHTRVNRWMDGLGTIVPILDPHVPEDAAP